MVQGGVLLLIALVLRHREVSFGTSSPHSLLGAVLGAHPRVLVNLARLFIFVENRLRRRVVNPQFIDCAPNRISL